MEFLYQLGGATKVQDNLKVQFHNEKGDIEFTPAALRVTGKLMLKEMHIRRRFLVSEIDQRAGTPKLTIPSPSMIHYRGGRAAIDAAVYPDMKQFWRDLSMAYADEVEQLGRLGCTYLQLDDTSLAYLNDPAQRAHMAQIGGDADNQHLVYIDLINGALEKKPAGMTVCTHLCRGNFRSSWVAAADTTTWPKLYSVG